MTQKALTEPIARKYSVPVYIVTTLTCIIGVVMYGFSFQGDTWSYFTAWDELLSGNIDVTRTPVYPVMCGLVFELTGRHLFAALAVIGVVQIGLYVWSMKYLLRCLRMAGASERTAMWLAMIPAAIPATWYVMVTNWSESPGVVLMILMSYCIMRIIRQGATRRRVWELCGWIVLAAMLRPAFMALAVLLPLVAAFVWRREDAPRMSLVLASLVPVVVWVGYCAAFQAAHGVFTSTKVGTINRLWILYENGDTKTDVITNPHLKAKLDSAYAEKGHDSFMEPANEIISLYGLPEATKASEDLMKANWATYRTHTVERLRNVGNSPWQFSYGMSYRGSTIMAIISPPVKILFWTWGFTAVFIVAGTVLRKRAKKPLCGKDDTTIAVSVMEWVMLGALMAPIILLTPNCWTRLLVVCVPSALICAATWASLLRAKIE